MPLWLVIVLALIIIYTVYSIVKGLTLTFRCRRLLRRHRMLLGEKVEELEEDSDSGDSGGL